MKNKTLNVYEFGIGRLFYFLFSVATGILGYQINVTAGSSSPLFWSIVDWLFCPFAWAKWLICQQVSISIIKHSFAWFLN